MKKRKLHSTKWLAGSMLMMSIAALAPIQHVHAQSKVAAHPEEAGIINGIVTDDKNEPLPGASVALKGSTVGTMTDINGHYEIELPKGTQKGILIITSVGFANKEVAFDGYADQNISMAAQSGDLNEVVVIGYGTAKKKDLTGSVATVSAKDFNKGVITSPDQFIQGKMAGVVITPSSGQPGVAGTIRIRGGSSFGASNDPLYVIDGVPLSYETINGAPSPLSMINPNDIESMTVLKDASATAIYGNRASNGVILITTKKGSGGDLKINLSSTVSLAARYNQLDLLNGNQMRNYVTANGTPDQIALLGKANTNWQNQIYKNAFASDNNLSISGGIKNLPYRLSLGYLGQDGILKTGSLKRTSVGLNLSPSLLDNHLKLDINVKGVMAKNRFANTDAIGDALNMDPTQAISNGSKYNGYYEWQKGTDTIPNQQATRNPLGALMAKNDISTVKRAISNIQADYRFHFLPGLRFVVNAGLDVTKSEGSVTIDPKSGIGYTNGGSYNTYSQYLRNQYLGEYFNYVLDIPDAKSHFDITAGHDYQDFYKDAPSYITTHGISPNDTALEVETRNTLESYYGRLNYSYMDRYLLTASFRKDGTSRFSPDNRWGSFNSLALAWRIKQEAFLKNSTFVSDLKLRVGVGSTGQQEIPNGYYGYLSSYDPSTNNSGYIFGSTPSHTLRANAYNQGLQWESTTGYNAGLDYGFWDNRVTGAIDVYTKKSSNLLVDYKTPAGANLSDHIIANIGDMVTKGIEFSIFVNAVSTKDVNWNIGLNMAYNKNKITNLNGGSDTSTQLFQTGDINGGSGNQVQVNTVGVPQNSFYLNQQVYDKNGNPMEGIYQRQGDGGLLRISKPSTPTFTIGFNTQFSYKKWSLSCSMHGSFGNYVYNNINSNSAFQSNILNPLSFIGNSTTDIYKTNFKTAQYLSDYYLENASFVRMDNVVLGYNFGSIAKKLSLSASFIIQNAFVITKYTGIDPEVFSGIDKNVYPKPRVYSLGVNLGF